VSTICLNDSKSTELIREVASNEKRGCVSPRVRAAVNKPGDSGVEVTKNVLIAPALRDKNLIWRRRRRKHARRSRSALKRNEPASQWSLSFITHSPGEKDALFGSVN